jgi:hypothetical protein
LEVEDWHGPVVLMQRMKQLSIFEQPKVFLPLQLVGSIEVKLSHLFNTLCFIYFN